MMRKSATVLVFLVALPALPALAEEECFVPMTDWQPRERVVELAAGNGWTVRRIKIDDGCYEIEGEDAGLSRIEVTIHPLTLDIISLEREHDDEQGEHD